MENSRKGNVRKTTVKERTPFKPMGRPTKITAAIIADIYDSVKMGMPKDKAAKLAGISEATYHNWMGKAREIVNAISEAKENGNAKEIEMSSNEYYMLQLLEAVTKGEAEFIYEATKSIRSEGPSGFKWLLSRLFRPQYGEKITVDGDEPLQLELVLPGEIEHPAQKEPERIGSPSDDEN